MKFKILCLVVLWLVACSPAAQTTLDPDVPVTNPPVGDISTTAPGQISFAPQPGDEKLTRSMIYLDEVSLIIRESYPPQISLALKGNLPTPCHELRLKVNPPDQENTIFAEAYSVIDPNEACAEVLQPLEEYIDLGTFSAGHYSVWVNGDRAGEFDS